MWLSNHAEKRCQQRGVSVDMAQLLLMYVDVKKARDGA